jgi:hypothetical protein
MLHHGPVRVPEDAQAGKAVMRVKHPQTSQFKSMATDIPVELIKKKAGE